MRDYCRYIGIPFVVGGRDINGFDCWGFLKHYYKNELNTAIGFVENRALFFDGQNNLHTDLQALGQSSFRYTINIFYNHG